MLQPQRLLNLTSVSNEDTKLLFLSNNGIRGKYVKRKFSHIISSESVAVEQ